MYTPKDLLEQFGRDIQNYIDYTFPYAYPVNLGKDREKLKEIFIKYIHANNQEEFNQSIKNLCSNWKGNSEYNCEFEDNSWKAVNSLVPEAVIEISKYYFNIK